MTHPNRVQPDGTFLATPARGTLTGNRGVLHRDGVIGPARWKHKSWVCCEVSFRGRHRPIMPPNRWTALFFLDEAVALAAGHRPCGQCRHEDYTSFTTAWGQVFGAWPGPKVADKILHAARADSGARTMRVHSARACDLPMGAMYRHEGQNYLRHDKDALRYDPTGYGKPQPLPNEQVAAFTNPVTQQVLKAGYRPRLHPSAT